MNSTPMTNERSLLFDQTMGLAGCQVLVTAGPTREPIDPVRYLSNRSSGKMGYAIAQACANAGAQVTLISGPVSLAAPDGVSLVSVESAADMLKACQAVFNEVDIAVLAAAVADYKPVSVAKQKLKKSQGGLKFLELQETEDILAELSAHKGERLVVGFAAETNDLLFHARAKLMSKGCDLIVANDVSRSDSTFGSPTNKVTLVFAQGELSLPLLPKCEVARQLVCVMANLRAGHIPHL